MKQNKKTLAEELRHVEQEYMEASEAVELLEDAAVDGELSFDAEKEKLDTEKKAKKHVKKAVAEAEEAR